MKIITHKEKHYIQTEFGYREILATTDKSLKIYESENLAEASGFSLKTNDIYLPQLPESFIQAYIKAYNEGKPITEVDLECYFTHETEGDKFLNIKTREDNTVIISPTKDYWKKELEKCSESPYYFYTNYCLINGEKPVSLLSEEKFNELWKKFGDQ